MTVEDNSIAVDASIPRSPAKHPPSKPGGESQVWPLYRERTEQYDETRFARWSSDMDILLIFAALLSAIISAFISQSIRDLKEDFSETSSELLSILVTQSLGQNDSFALPTPFNANKSSIIVNSFWFTSFVLSMGTCLGALLVKEWLKCYTARLSPNLDIQMLQQHSRFSAFERWNVSTYIDVLPVILRLSIVLFFAGLLVYLGPINTIVRDVTAVFVGVICAAYVAFILLPLFTTAPFATPITLIITGLMRKSVDYTLASIYAVFLFSMTVVPVAIQSRSIESIFKMSKQWAVVVRHSFRRVLHTAGFIMNQEQREDREVVHAEMLSWLVRHPSNNDSLERVVESLSQIQSYTSQRILVKNGVDIILLNHLQASCFHGIPSAPKEPIPERIPFALSCLDVISTIESSTSTTVQNAVWLGLPTDEMINSLLHATSGHDRLRVIGASVWLVNDYKKSLGYRRSIRQSLLDHINGVEELPDNLVKSFVDALHPSLGLISSSEIMCLLRIYLDRDTLPSIYCLHSILFNLYERGRKVSDSPTHRRFTNTHFIAHLLEKDEVDRSLYLRLIRILPLVHGPDSIIDAELSRNLLQLLDRAPSHNSENLVIEVLETICRSPTSCYAHDEALLRLTEVYKRQTSKQVSHAAIGAVASFMESVFRSYTPPFDSLEFDITKQTQRAVRVVAGELVRSIVPFIDDEIVSFSVYVLSMASSHVDGAFAATPIDTLLRTLQKLLCVPKSDHEAAIIHHILQIFRAIVVANRSTALVLAESMSIFERLATCDDPRVRWPSCEMLLFISFHLHPNERIRIFSAVREDIDFRLQSSKNRAFVDPNWRSLTDVITSLVDRPGLPSSKAALAEEIKAELQQSGVMQLLEGVPRRFVCEKSVLVPDDFLWLPPLYFQNL